MPSQLPTLPLPEYFLSGSEGCPAQPYHPPERCPALPHHPHHALFSAPTLTLTPSSPTVLLQDPMSLVQGDALLSPLLIKKELEEGRKTEVSDKEESKKRE